jgi:hypothetical protein
MGLRNVGPSPSYANYNSHILHSRHYEDVRSNWWWLPCIRNSRYVFSLNEIGHCIVQDSKNANADILVCANTSPFGPETETSLFCWADLNGFHLNGLITDRTMVTGYWLLTTAPSGHTRNELHFCMLRVSFLAFVLLGYISYHLEDCHSKMQTNSAALISQSNYTERAAAVCRRS